MTKGTKADLEIIQQVQDVRAKNNKCWMDLTRLALMAEPNLARAILKKITDNDAKVGALMAQLSNGGKR